MKTIFKFLIYAGYFCVVAMIGLVAFIGSIVGALTAPREEVKPISTDKIAKLDKIEALDGQIAVLEQEKRLYQEKAKYSTKQDDVVKWNKKAAAVEVQIVDKSAKVLKMRDEVEENV